MDARHGSTVTGRTHGATGIGRINPCLFRTIGRCRPAYQSAVHFLGGFATHRATFAFGCVELVWVLTLGLEAKNGRTIHRGTSGAAKVVWRIDPLIGKAVSWRSITRYSSTFIQGWRRRRRQITSIVGFADTLATAILARVNEPLIGSTFGNGKAFYISAFAGPSIILLVVLAQSLGIHNNNDDDATKSPNRKHRTLEELHGSTLPNNNNSRSIKTRANLSLLLFAIESDVMRKKEKGVARVVCFKIINRRGPS